jgi:hypothetical protein
MEAEAAEETLVAKLALVAGQPMEFRRKPMA